MRPIIGALLLVLVGASLSASPARVETTNLDIEFARGNSGRHDREKGILNG